MKIFELNETEDNIPILVSKLAEGKIFIYPTDTVYGIGCDATNPTSVKKIFAIKKRSLDKPLSVACADLEMVQKYTTLNPRQISILRKKLPGPYTFIVPARNLPSVLLADGTTVGIRVPAFGVLRTIIRKFGKPIVTTSANISGKKYTAVFSEIEKEILDHVDFSIKGDTGTGKPSEVIDLTKNEKYR